MDQSSFAAPHGLSQRTTSFIASCRQGIHRMLLGHLMLSLTMLTHSTPARTTLDKRSPSGPELGGTSIDQKDQIYFFEIDPT